MGMDSSAPRKGSSSDEQRVREVVSAGAVKSGEVVVGVGTRRPQCVRPVRP